MIPISKPDLTEYENEAISFDEVMKRLIEAKPKQRVAAKKLGLRPGGADRKTSNAAAPDVEANEP